LEEKKSASNRAFTERPNGLLAALKNRQKIPSIQILSNRDFALGAWRLSWQKQVQSAPGFAPLIRDILEGFT
jgi:hypothetical protein